MTRSKTLLAVSFLAAIGLACSGTPSSAPADTGVDAAVGRDVGDGAAADAGDPTDGGSATNVDPTADELSGRGSCPAQDGPGTTHQGSVTADETWTAAAGPHKVTTRVSIHANVTVEPCARVLLAKNAILEVGANDVAGSLVARGVSTTSGGARDIRPVNFDALVAGDSWGQIVVLPKGTLDLAVAALQNGGGDVGGERGALLVRGVAGGTNDGPLTRSAKVDRVLIEKSATYGVNLEAWGTFKEGSDLLTIRECGSAAFPSALRLEPGIAATLPTRLHAVGNVKNELLLLSNKTFMRDDTLVSRQLPYRQKGALYVNPSQDAAPITLTIEPGVTVEFDRNAGSGIYIGSSAARQGILVAAGTPSAPIVFTSAQPAKSPGDWMALYFRSTPSTGSLISHATIEYAGDDSSTSSFGCGPGDNDGAVLIQGVGAEGRGPDTAFIDYTDFENIAGNTVIVSGWIDPSGPKPDRYVQSNFEAVNFLKLGIQKSGFRGREDSMKLIEALEGMEVKEGDDFPQGDKLLRREDHQAFLREFIFDIKNGKHRLLDVIAREKTIVPPACTFPKA